MIAAIPKYVPLSSIQDSPPGHRFRLYFNGWNATNWQLEKDRKKNALDQVCPLGASSTLLEALNRRQLHLAHSRLTETTLHLEAVSEAPFVTGMGMEHPLENGFAFLDPYGLPYLPGSSVKGVVRRAAEELALFSEGSGWDILSIWWLFGFDQTSACFPAKDSGCQPVEEERQRWRKSYEKWVGSAVEDAVVSFLKAVLSKDEAKRWEGCPGEFLTALAENSEAGRALRSAVHLKGRLSFLDVLPQPPDGKLRVDIMNPHHSDYYQKGKAPGDWEDPNPIFFLTLPPGTRFRFLVQLESGKAAQRIPPRWRELVQEAFQHAFDWMGFGGKTSLGYGLMRRDEEAERRFAFELKAAEQTRQQQKQNEEEAARLAQVEKLAGVDRWVLDLEDCPEERANIIYKELDQLAGEDQKRLARALRAAYQRRQMWQGSSLTKGQKKKVTRIRQILEDAP